MEVVPMKKTMIITNVLVIILLMASAVEAGNTARVSVSARIPALLEMDTEQSEIEAAKAEIRDTTKRLCVQEERLTEAKLYSFYER